MDKLDLQTPNFTDENIEKLAILFPNCVTEARDAKGNVAKAIDFDLLKQELSDNIVDGPRERYQINWPGKRKALVSANTPINKTLRPCREESVEFDTTENLYIEGDNLEALKLLQESYLGKIKMIYIDPPYNTGKDFVYSDNFTVDKDEYDESSGQKDEIGGRLVANLESNGRFHSDWMSMIYPRLKLARNLLKDDGVICISIDENEVHNIRKICDELFGEENFISQAGWQKVYSPKNQARYLSNDYEFVLIYTKDINVFKVGLLPRTEEMNKRYKNPDNDPRGDWKSGDLVAAGERKGGHYIVQNPFTLEEHDVPSGKHWAFSEPRMREMLNDNRVYFGADKKSFPSFKQFLTEVKQGRVASSFFSYKDYGHTDGAKKEFINLFGEEGRTIFETIKPTKLIKNIIRIANLNDGDIVLDFFAGSSTTADGVMQLNFDDKHKYKFILVQITDETDEKSEAYKAGYGSIAEIGKERIRRARKKIKEDNAGKEGIKDLDTGFRVLKIDSSNMKDVYYSPDEVTQTNLFDTVENIKEGRSDEDLLFQVLLDWGVDLSLPIVREEIQGKTVYFVDEDTLAACFEDDLDEAFVKELASREVMRVVFKDSGFAQDDIKSNVEQIFKQLSPDTEVKAI